jgi:hypothetical protein
MNWGKGLVIALASFIALMIYFLISMLVSGSESVPKGYYEKGNKYQETINEEKAAVKFGARLSYEAGDAAFVLKYDSVAPDSGKVLLRWPPDETKNIKKRFVWSLEDKALVLPAAASSGGWLAEVEFYHNGIKYLHRQKVWVP